MRGDVAMTAFSGDPQPVEIFHRGIWYSGELLGWRHEDDGRCTARVRCVVDGLRHSAWKDFADLRLPGDERDIERDIEPASASPRRAARPPVPVRRYQGPDDDTRPHELLPRRMADGRPWPARPQVPAPLAPPRGYQEQRVSRV